MFWPAASWDTWIILLWTTTDLLKLWSTYFIGSLVSLIKKCVLHHALALIKALFKAKKKTEQLGPIFILVISFIS